MDLYKHVTQLRARQNILRLEAASPSMFTSCSQASRTTGTLPSVRRLSDDVFELHRPTEGQPDLEIAFFHGFQTENHQDAYLRTWMTADDSACWLITWLAAAFPQSRILSMSYDSTVETSASKEQMDLYLLGENIAFSLIERARVGQSCPVLLVGHCVGGLVLKQICIQAKRKGGSFRGSGINKYLTFLSYVRGVFFFATPHLGFRSQIIDRIRQKSPLVAYLEVYCKETARINGEFSELRKLHGWTVTALGEGNETRDCNAIVSSSPNFANQIDHETEYSSTLLVEEASARFDADEFSVLPGVDHFTICKPKSTESSNFVWFVTAVEKVLEREETGKQILHRTLRFPQTFVDMSVRVNDVIADLRLEQEEPSKLALVGMSGIGKTTLAKAVLASIKNLFDYVCFVEDVSEKLRYRDLSDLLAGSLFHGRGGEACSQGGGKHLIWHVLKGKRVLMIIDNVEDIEQISFLLDSD